MEEQKQWTGRSATDISVLSESLEGFCLASWELNWTQSMQTEILLHLFSFQFGCFPRGIRETGKLKSWWRASTLNRHISKLHQTRIALSLLSFEFLHFLSCVCIFSIFSFLSASLCGTTFRSNFPRQLSLSIARQLRLKWLSIVLFIYRNCFAPYLASDHRLSQFFCVRIHRPKWLMYRWLSASLWSLWPILRNLWTISAL